MTEEDINETIAKIRIDFLQKRIMALQDQIEIYRCWVRDLHKFLGIEGNEPKLIEDYKKEEE